MGAGHQLLLRLSGEIALKSMFSSVCELYENYLAHKCFFFP